MTLLRRQVLTVVALLFALSAGVALGGGPLSYVSDDDPVAREAPPDAGETPSSPSGDQDPASTDFADAFAAAAARRLYDAALGVQLYDGSTPLVAGVVDGGAAAKAGVSAGSTITTVGGTKVTSVKALQRAVATHEPGDRVAVTWTDAQGTAHTATATLGEAPIA